MYEIPIAMSWQAPNGVHRAVTDLASEVIQHHHPFRRRALPTEGMDASYRRLGVGDDLVDERHECDLMLRVELLAAKDEDSVADPPLRPSDRCPTAQQRHLDKRPIR